MGDTMEVDQTNFRLGAELQGHSMTVRAVCAGPQEAFFDVVTSSRDTSVRLWKRVDGTSKYECAVARLGHEHYVSAVCCLPNNDKYPTGAVVSGSRDKKVRLWPNVDGEVAPAVLEGHTGEVYCVKVAANGDIVSAGADMSIKLWRGGVNVYTYVGHTSAIWDVVPLADGSILSASADKTIRLWKDGVQLQTIYEGSADDEYYRGLTLIPNIGFAAVANDCLLRLFDMTGRLIDTVMGHVGAIYSVCMLPSGELATASEDKTVKVWRPTGGGFECAQTIPHPGPVWSVAALHNGDLATGCQDGIARVWTRSEERCADAATVSEFEMRLSTQETSAKSLGGLEISKLPGVEALSNPGTADGDRLIIQNEGRGEVYLWNTAEARWVHLGNVVDSPDDAAIGGKTMLDGVEYDKVISVDLGENDMRKLGFNASDDPYRVAEEFILREELPKEHLNTVAQFLIQNGCEGWNLDQGTDKSDGYVPGRASTRPAPSAAQRPLPERRAPAPAPAPANPSQPTADLFSNPTRPVAGTMVHIPKYGFLLHEAGEVSKAIAGLTKLNESVKQEAGGAELALDEVELATLARFGEVVEGKGGVRLVPGMFGVFMKVLQWPAKTVFPALDILRLAVIKPLLAKNYSLAAEAGMNVIEETLALPALKTGPIPYPVALMLCRFLTNMFKEQPTRDMMMNYVNSVFDSGFAGAAASHEDVRIRAAFGDVLVNFAVLFSETKDFTGSARVIDYILTEPVVKETHMDALYRSLVALGTMILSSPDCAELAKGMDAQAWVQSVSRIPNADPKVVQAASEIFTVLKE